ncbi:hypothetical protein ABZ729_08115 [Streptomyces sp. NPDC006678]|uniref:hypothetical protein n=1 Tax=Streptomyces sp. NPDC006678 TaxID=3157185 RepID=UPI0033FCB72E
MRANTVQPYAAGTQWTITSLHGHTQTHELALYAEPNYSTITDDYLPDEISAADLWRIWVDKVATLAHDKHPNHHRPGEVTILWTVTTPGVAGIFEAAPFTRPLPPDPQLVAMFGQVEEENFLTHYRPPVHVETGEPLNWLRLPVVDRGWNASRGDKGGFIQEVTGWKPSALQPTLDVLQLGRAAGLYVPNLDSLRSKGDRP